jgi:hypothetical protein
MLYGDNRDEIRKRFLEAWRKEQSGLPLEPLEQLIARIIHHHPEYQRLLADPGQALAEDYSPERGETNPFLHMGLHIAIQEQLAVDRPPGIQALYRRLCRRFDDAHDVEHRMMEALGECLWEAQRSGLPPDEARYLGQLRRLLKAEP